MADVKPGARPLSPHLTVYRLQITSALSILHRISGVGLAFGAALVVWWLLAAATGPEYFDTANAVLTSWIGLLVLFVATWGLFFHLCNGIRHLWWDMGYGFEMEQVTLSGQIVLVASAVLTIFVWVTAI
jgi:succinate dehydrogenase / fumarate reductase cytochrome b subunit